MATKIDRASTVMEPLPDPPKGRDMQQLGHTVGVYTTLGAFFQERGDVLVSGQGYLLFSTGSVRDWAEHFYPDCVVAFGVDPESIVERNGYVISEVGKPPDFVLEIASKTTSSRDETVKLEGYANLMVPEYWMFDGSGKGYYSSVLSGNRLVGDAYQPIELTEEADGEVRGYSPTLSLYLCADVENRLRFWDPTTQEYLPTHKESLKGHREALEEQARAEAELERERAELERGRAALERERAALERERAARIEAQAEVERLRDRLRSSDLG